MRRFYADVVLRAGSVVAEGYFHMDSLGDGHAVLHGGGEAVLLYGVDGAFVETHADGLLHVHIDWDALSVDGEGEDAYAGEFGGAGFGTLLRIDAM